MTSTIDQRAWDSAACLAFLLNEPGRADACQGVLDAAEDGKLELVISALVIAEVLALRGKQPIPQAEATMVRQCFRRQSFLVVNLDRFIAEHAREVVWDKGIKPKDAIHVATALSANVPFLDTFDAGLIAKSGQVGGDPRLVICQPGDGMQKQLDL